MPFLVKPNFNRLRNIVTFEAPSLNAFVREELLDSSSFYQEQFGVYSYMQLNQQLKYVIHSLKGSPLMWQPHNACGWDPTGSLRVGTREFEPCRAKINETVCYDELFDSCFRAFLNWSGNGPVTMNAQGMNMVNQLVQTIAENATLGARLTLTVGQMYEGDVVFNDKTPQNIKELFTKTVGTCKGWVELVRELAIQEQYAHLNVPGLFIPADFDGNKYIGNVVDLYDELQAAAPNELQSLINEGGVVNSFSNSFMPLFLVSTSVYNKLIAEYRQQGAGVVVLDPRLTRREFPVTVGGRTTIKFVYYIDDTPVVPISEISYLDQYLTGSTHLAAITAAGNIGLGTSFAAMPDLNGGQVGLRIQMADDNDKFGEYSFLAHSLFAATLADPNYFVGTQTFVQP